MAWQDHIVADPKILTGKPTIKGTRLAVEFILGVLGRGWTIEKVLREYGQLTKEDVEACVESSR